LPDSCLEFTHQNRRVRPAEAEGVRKNYAQNRGLRFVRYNVQIDIFICGVKIDVGRKKLMLEGQETDDRFDSAGCP
jgi:hypothetical protein